MKPSEDIKSISYLKTHASELIRDISENNKTILITQKGEAKVAVQDIKVYEQFQESLAMLKILAISQESLKEGKYKPREKAFADIRERFQKYRKR